MKHRQGPHLSIRIVIWCSHMHFSIFFHIVKELDGKAFWYNSPFHSVWIIRETSPTYLWAELLINGLVKFSIACFVCCFLSSLWLVFKRELLRQIFVNWIHIRGYIHLLEQIHLLELYKPKPILEPWIFSSRVDAIFPLYVATYISKLSECVKHLSEVCNTDYDSHHVEW